MKNFLSVEDVSGIDSLIDQAMVFKKDPYAQEFIGKRKTLGLIFFNPSLRTRLSTIKAAHHLGMETIVMNVSKDSWKLETAQGAVMDAGNAEHIKDAAAVMGSYCDILGVRSFAKLQDRNVDYSEKTLASFVRYAGVPIINLESPTVHPLQSLTDLMSIKEVINNKNAKIVLAWAPHVKSLPQAVANSFAQWVNKTSHELVISCPKGFELSPEFTGKATILHDQCSAYRSADVVYAKNWSSYNDYGKIGNHADWIIDKQKMSRTNNGIFMHCLPVRRNVVVKDEVLDSEESIHIQQASNRVWAAQAVLFSILKDTG